MKSIQRTITSANSPFVCPVNYRGGSVSLAVTPTAGTYTSEYSVTPMQEGLNINWFPITDMTAATTAVSLAMDPVTAVRVTLDSGTSLSVDIAQSDE